MVCRPYRAKTKGKVEHFNHYLKNSFVVPLSARLQGAGLILDVATANSKIGPWLVEKANARVHQTTGEISQVRLNEEMQVFLALPASKTTSVSRDSIPVFRAMSQGDCLRAMPFESLQHPLEIYDQLLGSAQ